MACIVELLGMPPQKLIEQGKRAKNFISSKGLPRYCTATTLPDGSTMLNGGEWKDYHFEVTDRRLETIESIYSQNIVIAYI